LVQAHGRTPRRRPAQDALRGRCAPALSHAPPPPGRHPGPGPAPVSARRPGGAAAGTPAKRRPWAPINPCASQARPTRHHPFPSGLVQAGDHGAHRPRGHVDPLRPIRRRPATRATPGSSAARTARRRRRGHRRPVRPDTWMHRTPGHRTPGRWTPGRWTSARLVGRTSSRRDWGRGQGNDRPGRRPDISSRPATTR
jgi:hypothetical protein